MPWGVQNYAKVRKPEVNTSAPLFKEQMALKYLLLRFEDRAEGV